MKNTQLVDMRFALPKVTSRVLVVGFRLGVAEQHVFQCGFFLYPRITGENEETGGFTPAGLLRFQVREVCCQTPSAGLIFAR